MSVKKIDIDLDRPSGIYYGGEVVKGTVAVTCSGQVKCRGLHVRLDGQAHVFWQEGAGESVSTFDAYTSFVSHRHTLEGSFWKTDVLDNAGENAFFGQVYGDGDMLIPCNRKDEMKLVVRVMDYAWGKQDEVLGEILIDAAELVESKVVKRYPLTRFGKPEIGEVALSGKFVPIEARLPGSTDASVFPDVFELKVHQATGLRKAGWVGQNYVYVQTYHYDTNSKQSRKGQLPDPEPKLVLQPGTKKYRFAFPIPIDAPGSCELAVEDRAWIRYSLYAHVDFAMWRDPSNRRLISVIPSRPVPLPQLLTPVTAVVQNETLDSCQFCCFSCGKMDGSVSIHQDLERQSFAPGEKILFSESAAVVNDTSSQLQFTITLVQHVYMSTGGSRVKRTLNYDLYSSTLEQHSKKALKDIQICVPSVFPSFEGGVQESSSGQDSRYACLAFEYTLEVGLQKRGGSKVKSPVPILIACAPPYPDVVDSLKGSPSREVNPWNFAKLLIFDDAISGPEHSSTTPLLTGPVDGGKIVQAASAEFVNQWQQEDAGQLGPAVPFAPVVSTFPAEPKHEVVIKAAATADIDNGMLWLQLLDNFGSASDHRLVLGEWIKQHPKAASKLTPQQVGDVLSKVSFAFDQPSVASELAVGFDRTRSLTCAHVIAALKSCPYQKVDVAKAMLAKGVSDPENAQKVLNEIEFSYERDMVNEVFRRQSKS